MSENQPSSDEPPSKINADKENIIILDNDSKSNIDNSLIKKIRGRVVKMFFPSGNSLEEDIAEFIEERDPEGTKISAEERNIMHNVFGLSEIKVSDMMIPRTDIIAIEQNISLSDLKEIISDKEHTRMPIYNDSLDKVIGVLHVKDLLPLIGDDDNFSLSNIVREILYVPPSMKMMDLLVAMRDRRIHIALVVDEYGGTDGLVTMEDLMEEIVGEIEDEHDDIEKDDFVKISDNSFEVSARFEIEEIEEKLNISLQLEKETEDYDTIGGMIFSMLGRVPELNEVIKHPNNIDFKIVDSDSRRINKVLIVLNFNQTS